MPPGIDVQIDLKRSPDLINIMCDDNTTEANRYKPKIVDMSMKVKYVTVTADIYQTKIKQMDLQGLSIPQPRYHLAQHALPNQQTMNLSILRNQKLPVYMASVYTSRMRVNTLESLSGTSTPVQP